MLLVLEVTGLFLQRLNFTLCPELIHNALLTFEKGYFIPI